MTFTKFIPIIILFFCLLDSPTAQRTISGKIIYEDGSPQIGAGVLPFDANKDFVKIDGKVIATTTDIDGNYSITIPESIVYVGLSYEGTFNVTFPLPPGNILNIINAEKTPKYYQPKSKEDFASKRTFSVSVRGVIYDPYRFPKKRKNKLSAEDFQIVNVAADGTILKTTSIDEGGNFFMEIPPESDILKVQYKWYPEYYFNIGTTSTVFIPMSIVLGYMSKKEIKKLKKNWKRQEKSKKKN